MKISFIGDIMCEPLMLKAAKKEGYYDFTQTFTNVKELFSESDYVIGNLETPLAGEKAMYTNSLLSFNAPDAFADALKEAGIKMVLTANNHCLDRGTVGLKRTLEVLDNKGIAYAGTWKSQRERKAATYFSVNNTRFAIIAYTYGTNYGSNHTLLSSQEAYIINLLKPQQEPYFVTSKKSIPLHTRAINRVLRKIPEERRFYIKKALGITVNYPHEDDYLNIETMQSYIDTLREDIGIARSNADYVIFCPHLGGQFNEKPGIFSKYVFEKAIEAGCDAIVASHTHVIMNAQYRNGIPCFYSLGNFSMSPNSVYLLHDLKPEYGLAVHFYIGSTGIEKTTYTILKIVEKKNEILTVYPVDMIFRNSSIKDEEQVLKDINFLRSRIHGFQIADSDIRREYLLDVGV